MLTRKRGQPEVLCIWYGVKMAVITRYVMLQNRLWRIMLNSKTIRKKSQLGGPEIWNIMIFKLSGNFDYNAFYKILQYF